MQQETRQVPNPLNNPIYLTKMTKSTKKPLFLKAIILGMIFFLPTASPATDYSPITLLQFLETEHTPRFSLLPNAFLLQTTLSRPQPLRTLDRSCKYKGQLMFIIKGKQQYTN